MPPLHSSVGRSWLQLFLLSQTYNVPASLSVCVCVSMEAKEKKVFRLEDITRAYRPTNWQAPPLHRGKQKKSTSPPPFSIFISFFYASQIYDSNLFGGPRWISCFTQLTMMMGSNLNRRSPYFASASWWTLRSSSFHLGRAGAAD